MDVREKVKYSEDILDFMQESAERYCRLYADSKRVGVNVRSVYGSCEPFFIFSSLHCSKSVPRNVPFFITRSQLDKLELGCGEIYGRMERDSRFYLLRVVFFRITDLKAVSYFDQEDIRKLVYEE